MIRMLKKGKTFIKERYKKNNNNVSNIMEQPTEILNTNKIYKHVKNITYGGHSLVNKVKDGSGTTFISKEYKYKDKRYANREYNILTKINKKNDFNRNDFPLIVDYLLKPEEEKIQLIMEHNKNAVDLFDWAHKNKRNEQENKEIFLEMVRLTNLLHSYGFVHLDIKLENFLIINTNPIKLKMIDFDMSHSFNKKKSKISKIVGTRGYSPIEIYEGYYSDKSDIWSLGVCLWVLLTKEQPFKHKNIERYADRKIRDLLLSTNLFTFPNLYHETVKINPDAFDLIKKILVTNIDERINLDKIQKHKWFKDK